MDDKNLKPKWDYDPTIPASPHRNAPLQSADGAQSKNANNAAYQNKNTGTPCTKQARTKTELLDCLTREHQERPGDPAVRAQIYNAVKEVVDRDPYLEYHAENTQAYRVVDRSNEILIVPKERAKPEPFPVKRPEPIRRAYRYLLYAALGLVLSGIGAVLFAPVAARFAFRAIGSIPVAGNALERELARADRTRAWVVIGLAVILFAAGLALTYLLWIHIRG